MTVTYLKRARTRAPGETNDLRDLVAFMLTTIEHEREASVRSCARRLDNWEGAIVLPDETRAHPGNYARSP